MKIFVLLPRIPYPLEKGDKLRAFNQIKQLAKHNEIVLCALNDNTKVSEQDAFHALQPYCQSISFISINKAQILLGLVRAFFKGLPLQCGYFYNRKAAKRIDMLITKHKPDMLFGQLLRVAEYIRHKSIPKALDYQDIFSYNNDTNCPEIIFAFSSDLIYNKKSTNMRNGPFMSYVFMNYFDTTQRHAGWNCTATTPSFDNSSDFYAQCVENVQVGADTTYRSNGTIKSITPIFEPRVIKEMYDKELATCFLDPPYNDKLGAVHERYDPRDIRLLPPYGDDSGNWGGMFLEGVMREHYGTGEVQMADADRNGMGLVYVDQIGNFQGKGNHPVQIVENPRWGETNSGLRTAKYPYYTTNSGFDFCDPDVVEFRLGQEPGQLRAQALLLRRRLEQSRCPSHDRQAPRRRQGPGSARLQRRLRHGPHAQRVGPRVLR